MTELILDGHKLNWHRTRLEEWRRGQRIAPITIDCALTRACNYHCEYCYGQLQENEGHNLSKDVIFRFLDDAAEIDVKGISFISDGESTLSPHVYDAIRRGKQNGIDMALGTNGFALKQDKIGKALESLTYLRFNISAGVPDRYAKIHGVGTNAYWKVRDIISFCASEKKRRNLPVTIGLQMVLLPSYEQDIIPLVKFGKYCGVDYLIIKHCSDDEDGSLGVDYDKYETLYETLKKAESMSEKDYLVKVKWSKIQNGKIKKYSKCLAAPFMIQMSGSGLVAPCGFLFNDKYKEKFHIGNIAEKSFKEIWQSERYWEVMNYLVSERFNANRDCGTLCLQHKVNEFLWELQKNHFVLPHSNCPKPPHVNFI